MSTFLLLGIWFSCDSVIGPAPIIMERMHPDRLEEFRSQFREAKAKRIRRSLRPAPRFDSVYRAAVARMAEEEVSVVLTGTVHIPEEVKERLRDYRDGEPYS